MARARQAAGRVLTRGGLDADGERMLVWTDQVLNDLDRAALAREA